MKRCLNCMETYEESYVRCPRCSYKEGLEPYREICLNAGSILNGRYIVGTCQKVRETDITYIGWDALFSRKILIQEFYPGACGVVREGEVVKVPDAKWEQYQDGVMQYAVHGKELIRLYKEMDIITVHSCFLANQTAYLIMEYREMDTLEEWLSGRPLEASEALELLRKAGNAVKKVHELSVIHGQIGLDTFWISGNGGLILKDFAVSRCLCGPEDSLDYQNPGPWTDVYGLAALFYAMVTGRKYHDYRRLETELAPVRKLRLGGTVINALKNALAGTPRCRTRTVEEFQQQMSGEGAMVAVRGRGNGKVQPMRLSKGVKITSAILGVLVLCMIMGSAMISDSPKSVRERATVSDAETDMAGDEAEGYVAGKESPGNSDNLAQASGNKLGEQEPLKSIKEAEGQRAGKELILENSDQGAVGGYKSEVTNEVTNNSTKQENNAENSGSDKIQNVAAAPASKKQSKETDRQPERQRTGETPVSVTPDTDTGSPETQDENSESGLSGNKGASSSATSNTDTGTSTTQGGNNGASGEGDRTSGSSPGEDKNMPTEPKPDVNHAMQGDAENGPGVVPPPKSKEEVTSVPPAPESREGTHN